MKTPADFHSEVDTLVDDFAKLKADRSAAVPVMIRFYRRMDAAISHFSPALACESGCSYCCNYHVYVSVPEAFALASFLQNTLDPVSKQGVLARLDANLLTVKELTVDEHIATNVRCAFLSDLGRCLAYEVRPGACRRHHAIDVTPCRVTFEDPQSTMELQQIAERMNIANGYIQATSFAQQNQKMDASMYELHGAVHEALSNKSSLKRWRDGKTAFPGVHDRSPAQDFS